MTWMPEDSTDSTIISDTGYIGPPQNIDTTVALTPAQLERVREKIRNHLAFIRNKKETKAFGRAIRWVYKTFSYDIHMWSDFVPPPTYGVTFDDFVSFIHRMEKDAEAEEIVEEDGAQD